MSTPTPLERVGVDAAGAVGDNSRRTGEINDDTLAYDGKVDDADDDDVAVSASLLPRASGKRHPYGDDDDYDDYDDDDDDDDDDGGGDLNTPASASSTMATCRSLFSLRSLTEFWRLKLLHMSLFAAFASLAPFLSIFCAHLGLDGEQTGVVLASVPLVSLFVTPLVTAFADARRAHREALLSTLLGTALASTALMLCVYLPPSPSLRTHVLVALVAVRSAVQCAVVPLLDNAVIATLEADHADAGGGAAYGRSRLWGAVGWGVSAPIVARLADATHSVFPFFYVHVVGLGVVWLLVYNFDQLHHTKRARPSSRASAAGATQRDDDDDDDVDDDDDDAAAAADDDDDHHHHHHHHRHHRHSDDEQPLGDTGASGGVQRALAAIAVRARRTWHTTLAPFATVRTTVFLAVMTVYGVGFAVIGNYLFLFLADDLHADDSVLGLSLTFTVLFELPFFFAARWLLDKLGTHAMLAVALAVYVVRLFAYTLLTAPWQVYLVEPCHGITFSLCWTAGVEYMRTAVPERLRATSQGVLSAALNGVGKSLGTLVGGVVWKHVGHLALFRATAVMQAIALVVFLLFNAPYARARDWCRHRV